MNIQKVTAKTARLQTIFDDWYSLDVQRERVRTNDELSTTGKLNAYKQIEQKRALLRDNALEAFTAEYDRQQAAMKANDKARGRAEDESRLRWKGYGDSVDVEVKRIERLLKSNKPVSELMREWKNARDSIILTVAWYIALTVLPSNNMDLIALRNEVSAEYAAICNTPELERIKANGRALADAALGLESDTFQFMNLLSRSGDVSGAGRELQNLTTRIKKTPLPAGTVLVDFGNSAKDEIEKLMQPETFTVTG